MSNVYPALIVMALVTYMIRVLPIILIKGKLKSKFVKSFLYYMPYAVLGAMTFPGILYSTGNILASVIGGAFALFLAYHNQEMIKVAIGGILAAYICQLLL
ncbi:MAG: AzlD domain-containing protein [Tepidanaerobacteraceae bacterium]|jgi:branched-subunit amino acid transport protein|uniref:AzlD domain-containing protein n=1 Tax=Tepidanaerobacter acetatoxydans TaxID=499229 RepID=UPI0026EF5475|nr:AzlD domain-containing protein [Tepidanaerobacter acetatoxydans]NLU09791.1 AzlD domain-containing protein [Tepidanaerobacter acetatoxydans]